MPRLFLALDPPGEAKERLAEITYGVAGVSWRSPEQMHLTIRFIGETGESTFRSLMQALGAVQARAFHLRLAGVGHFPPRGEPQVVWAGVERNQSLFSLRNKVEALLVRQGLPPETRKFHPHVTLGKVREARADQVALFIKRNSLLRVESVPVNAFHLFSSVLTGEGPVYRREASYALEGRLEGDGE